MNVVFIRSFLHFYKQITAFNLPTAIFTGIVVPIGHVGIKGFLTTFSLVFITVGFIGGLYFFELRRKKQFYFYHNLGWTRLQLYIITFIINIIIIIPILIIR